MLPLHHRTTTSFSVASLLLPPTSALSVFPPSLLTPASSSFPYSTAPLPLCFAPASVPSAHTVVSWSLPSVPSCSAPTFSSLASVAPFFAPPALSRGPSAPTPPPSFPPSSSSFPFSSAQPCSSSTANALVGAPQSSSDAFAAGRSGAAESSVLDGAFYYSEFDDSSVKGEKEETAVSKASFSKAFQEVVSLITGFFSRAKPNSSSVSIDDSVPREDICGPFSGHDPQILNAF